MDGHTAHPYRILGKVAEGAQGSVYEAVHERMGRRVALKFLNRNSLLDADDRERFAREARIAAQLDHPSICQIFDYVDMQGQVFLAMPYLDGRNLRSVLQDGPLPLRDAVLIAIQVAEGLQEAHRLGVIHRDIKPSNIMIIDDIGGHLQAKILDFGLARGHDSTVLTRTGTVMGTAAYMSPEQVLGRPLDARTDIWSLGAVLYEMISGQRAFPGDSSQAVTYGITHMKPAALRTLRPESRPELRRIVGKALEHDLHDRYRDTAEMLADLRALRQEMSARRDPLRDWLWKYRNRMALASAGVVALAIVAIGLSTVQQGISRQSVALGHPRQITFGEEWEGEPSLSPDGSRVAFCRFNGIDHDLYWVGVKGGEPVPIATGPADDRTPRWLPDGSGLIFASNRGGQKGLWKADLSGGQFPLVPGAGDPGVSPDGLRLAFTRPDSTGHLRVCLASLADPAAWRTVSGGVPGIWSHFSPTFSPDGTMLCFTDYHDLWLLDPDSGEFRRLTTGGTWDSNPAWSPDGRYVYFASRRDGSEALWRIATNGGDPVRLTPGSGPEGHPSLDAVGRYLAYSTEKAAVNVLLVDRQGVTRRLTTGGTLAQQPALAPDADYVVYTSRRQNGAYCLWRQNLEDGLPVGREIQLTDQSGDASHPFVSPDGRWIAYYVIDSGDGNRDIWTVPAQGGTPIRVTVFPGQDSSPSWSPDGARISYCSECDGLPAIFIVAVDDGMPSGDPVRVSPPGLAASYPAWSADGRDIVFLGQADEEWNVFVVPLATGGEVRRLSTGIDIQLLRSIPESGEIWASADWGDGGLSIRRIDPAGGGSRPLDPPLRIPAGSTFGWFNTDASGQRVVLNEESLTGDIWIIEAQGVERF